MSTSEPAGGDPRTAVLDSLRTAVGRVAAEPAGPRTAAQEADAAGVDASEYARAKKRALNMLAARDHGSAELRDKLLAREHPPEVVECLLERLERSGLIDDEAFARAFVRANRERRALSKTALRRELSRKGLEAQTVAAAVDPVADEHEVAFGVAMKKARSTVGLPRETRERRILGMLARRGFPSGVCIDVTRRALDET
ncbi:regulatory protein RecX [Brevibacterium sp. 5221]|uniref:Regulatory protein RecX n=1 Tax=Brevibacterium rongguiense TaxID=2695267 RepID=A0A6N9H6B4_9MICO|nr:regulatory protein RecX [Brevibacterium rongguiense]MYM19489.1 regulatory protein RecX [Brevibacterium rongguiense]